MCRAILHPHLVKPLAELNSSTVIAQIQELIDKKEETPSWMTEELCLTFIAGWIAARKRYDKTDAGQQMLSHYCFLTPCLDEWKE